MEPISLILILFTMTTALSLLAVRLKIPYPTAMVIAGSLIGLAVYFVPAFSGLSIRLDPNVFFTAVLPPLLYTAAWYTSWNRFRENLFAILLLAIGAVLFTTVGIAGLAVWMVPGFAWPAAFVLGAIVSPPDAVAVSAIMERLRIPRRIATILEGESLVNDASALVVFQFALAAVTTGTFSLSAALLQFPLTAGGGIAVGLVVAYILRQVHQRIDQPLIETALTLLAPYAAYLTAEHFHTSGVLAVVTCGLVLSRYSSRMFSPQTRLTAISLWNFLTFVLNGLVFTLIGLQLPTILRSLRATAGHPVLDAAVICAALVALRMVWVFPGAYFPMLSRRACRRNPAPPLKHVFLISWIGMRGVVSLAAALALPERLQDGSAFPERDWILFFAFAVILVTLVFQSLTLPALIKVLKIEGPENERCEEADARRRALGAALNLLASEAPSHGVSVLRNFYTHRLEHLADCNDPAAGPDPENTLQRRTIAAQRTTLVQLRNQGQMTDELLRKLEHELDLEESRIPR